MTTVKQKKDFTTGPIFFRLTTFAIPIILTGLLQIFYNMADNIVVGQFSSDPNALAAVGSTLTVINLIINFLIGIGFGAGIVVAQYIGAKEHKLTSQTVHTAVLLSVISGFILAALGFIFSRAILEALGTKPELIDSATLYLRIICLGVPAQTVYNFGSAIQRSAGDSKTPLYILAASGIINVALNLVFVIGCDMSVDGVAIATIISQYLSAAAIIFTLMIRKDSCKLTLKELKINLSLMKRILALGLPAGIQSGVFAFANMLLTKAINSLTTATVYAYTVVSNVDGITLTVMNSYQQSATTFAAQNYGAKKYDRIVKSTVFSTIWSVMAALIVGQATLIFAEPISSLFINSENALKSEIMESVIPMLTVMINTLPICATMNIAAGALRGVSRSLVSMLACIICVVGGRISWIYIFFPMERFHTPKGLMISFPVAWLFASIVLWSAILIIFRKVKKECSDGTKE